MSGCTSWRELQGDSDLGVGRHEIVCSSGSVVTFSLVLLWKGGFSLVSPPPFLFMATLQAAGAAGDGERGGDSPLFLTRFVWPYGGTKVFLTGSFTGWSRHLQMMPVEGCPTVFQTIQRLAPGVHMVSELALVKYTFYPRLLSTWWKILWSCTRCQ